MNIRTVHAHERDRKREAVETKPGRKRDWQEPKLRFVEPKLTKRGGMQELTAGFIGSFVP